MLSLENRQNDRRLGGVAKVLHRAEVVVDSGTGACTNASQANIIVGELREQNVTHDAIRTAQRGDDGERWIAEGTVSPSRLFLLVVLPSLLIASRYRPCACFAFCLPGDDVMMDDGTMNGRRQKMACGLSVDSMTRGTARRIAVFLHSRVGKEQRSVQDGLPSGKQRGAAPCPPQY